MSQGVLVTRLAVRELWMTFRLLIVLVAFVGVSAVVVLVPAPPSTVLARLAAGLGVSTIIAAGVAGWSVAAERSAGRAGWLVTRSVARASLLAGWFCGIGLIVLSGILGAGLLGWLAVLGVPNRIDPAAFVLVLAAIVASAASAVAMALLAGALLPARVAGLISILAAGATAVATWAVAPADPRAPGSGFWLMTELTSHRATVADGLQASGSGLLLAGLILVLARIAFERADL